MTRISYYVYLGTALLGIPLVITYLVVISRIFSRLEREHPQKFVELGEPSLFFNNSIKHGVRITKFLMTREYKTMPDPTLVRLANFARLEYIAALVLYGASALTLFLYWAIWQ